VDTNNSQTIHNKKIFLDQDPHETIFVTSSVTVEQTDDQGEPWQPPLLEVEGTFCLGMDGGGSTMRLFTGAPADDLGECLEELEAHKDVIDQFILMLAEYRTGLIEAEAWLKEHASATAS